MASPNLTAAVERLEKIAAEYQERAERFAVYHRDMSRRGLETVWDERAKEEAEAVEALRLLLSALQRQEEATSLDRMIEPAPEVWVRFADNGGIRMWKATPFDGAHRYVLRPTSGASDVQR